MNENKDWYKIINDLNVRVDKVASKYTNTNIVKTSPEMTTQVLTTYQPKNTESKKNIFDIFKKNKIITLLSFFGGSFLICFLYLFIAKPNFVIKKVKNPETFFIEHKVNYKLIMIMSVSFGLVVSFLIYKFTGLIRN